MGAEQSLLPGFPYRGSIDADGRIAKECIPGRRRYRSSLHGQAASIFSLPRGGPAANGTEVPNKMDKDRVIGVGKQVAGSVKAIVGKLVGDAKMQADGKAEHVEGRLQNAVGSAKDTLKR
jgi:uncharacterized protein YjbJ (UPF0337 family)